MSLLLVLNCLKLEYSNYKKTTEERILTNYIRHIL